MQYRKEFYTTELHDDMERNVAEVVEYRFNMTKRMKNYMDSLSKKNILK